MKDFEINTGKRYETSETAHVEVYGRMGRLVSKMRNISTTGAFLELANGDYMPKKGDLVKATVHLHSLGRSRVVDAEVIWNSGLGFGISFLKKQQLLERMFQR